MQSIQSDAEGGVNAFILSQTNVPGEALLTLVQFDTEYEFLHRGTPIRKVPKYQLVPRGMTALLDAVGRAINETGARLAAMPEAERPGLVVFVVMTDGEENSSKEFTKATVKEMIERQQSQFQWQFTFLGANQDAFEEAGGMGIDCGGTANFSPFKFDATMNIMSNKVTRMRHQTRAGAPVDNAFTDQEREEMQ